MRIGLLGPADGDPSLVRKASEFLLDRAGAEQVVYLGSDTSAQHCAHSWASELMGFTPTEAGFLERACKLACQGSHEELEELLARDQRLTRVEALRCLPEAPARAVEMFEGKVLLLVHDKAQLDAEDIANAFLVVYGRSKAVALNHFGPRTFFAPGPLKLGQVALLEPGVDGSLVITQLDFNSGEQLSRTVLETRRAKMVVLS